MELMDQRDRERLAEKRRRERVDDAWDDWVETFACPVCGAAPGQRCWLGDRDLEIYEGYRSHAAREAQIGERLHDPRTSVRTVSGGGFEMNRHRH
jgi:hypothetical protein